MRHRLPSRPQRIWMTFRNFRYVAGALLVALSAAAPLSATANFQSAVEAYNSGDFETAYQEWLLYAAENDSRALYNLGQMYRLGKGVEKNLLIAEQYYRRAASVGHIGAHGNLGSLYFSKSPPQFDQALYHWRIAARGGHARSQYLLGIQYFNGEHMSQDLVQAYAWTSLAADVGLTEAAESLDAMSPYMGAGQIAEARHIGASLMSPGVAQIRARQTDLTGKSDAVDEAGGTSERLGDLLISGELASSGELAIESADEEVAEPASLAESGTGEPIDRQSGALMPIREDISDQRLMSDAGGSGAGQIVISATSEARSEPIAEPTPEPAPEEPTPEPAPVPGPVPGPVPEQPNALPEIDLGDGVFRVQVASLSTRAAGEALWRTLSDDHASLLRGHGYQISEASQVQRTLYRLRIGSFPTRNEARGLCDRLKDRGVDCFLIVPE